MAGQKWDNSSIERQRPQKSNRQKCGPCRWPKEFLRACLKTGAGGGELALAAEAGIDTFITAEGPHWTFPLAEELGVNVFYAGHYVTETFGVQALAEHLSQNYRLPWLFFDHPSGL